MKRDRTFLASYLIDEAVGWLLGDGCPLVAVDVDSPVRALVLGELCAGGELPFLVQLLKGIHNPLLKDPLAGVVAQDASDVAQLQLGDLLGFGGVGAGGEGLQGITSKTKFYKLPAAGDKS